MQASVIICTWNRSALLRETLSRFKRLEIPATVAWELLVVDNNSDDETETVVRSYERELPVKHVFESRQGLSYARNRGVAEARGDLLLFTDDDVLVSSSWLDSYVHAARAFPDAVFFGGPIEPWFEVEPPAWVKKHFLQLQGVFAIRCADRGTEQRARHLRPDELPFGANFAVRSSAVGTDPFPVELGRSGAELLSGEETHLLQGLAEETGSGAGVWVSTAVVEHWVPAERMTARYLYRFYHGLGRTEVLQRPPAGHRAVRGIPVWLIRIYIQSSFLMVVLHPFKNEAWLDALKQAARCRGMISQIRGWHAA